ncbi:MAG: hypothetical protein NTW27_01575 [Deltaproteobacteria bacterium]|nr:hypothetical protein [Deltaproteobacteria bacterium]
MKTFILILSLRLVASAMSWAETTYVRDSSGRLMRTQDQQGSQTTVRDPDGRTDHRDLGVSGRRKGRAGPLWEEN